MYKRQDWQWWLESWQYVLDAADIGPGDRVVLAFSFGPYIGFWSAHDALVARGAMAVSYTHLRAHETVLDLVCRLLLEKKKTHHLTPSVLYH